LQCKVSLTTPHAKGNDSVDEINLSLKLDSPHFSLHSSMASSHKPLSLYVHIPFCKVKCTYCDFYSIVGRETAIPSYLESILAEIRESKDKLDLSDYHLDTIFFGGGTPNLLKPEFMDTLLETLLKVTQPGQDMEIGMEINPGEATLEDLKAYKEMGINRISIGMQSFQPHLLKFMSRIHTAEKSFRTFEAVREAGFKNVSADLIFAIPGQTRDEWIQDLERLVRMGPEHISTYSLTVEEDTALHRWVNAGHVKMLEESVDNGMYAWGRDFLETSGYPNYEISNHAKPGYECKHNLNYWTGVDYLGYGPAAHSFFNNNRSWNLRNLDAYMASSGNISAYKAGSEEITPQMAANEMILTRLRLARGLDLSAYSKISNEDLLVNKADTISKWSPHLELVAGRLRVTREGWALTDEISSDLMS